jgi:hypothetical protein
MSQSSTTPSDPIEPAGAPDPRAAVSPRTPRRWGRLIALLLLPLVYMGAAAVLFQIGGDWPTEVRASALMLVLGLAVSLGGYYFGSSNKASVPGK